MPKPKKAPIGSKRVVIVDPKPDCSMCGGVGVVPPTLLPGGGFCSCGSVHTASLAEVIAIAVGMSKE